jgi:DNA-binding LacI/PurR family transcriptional regulator
VQPAGQRRPRGDRQRRGGDLRGTLNTSRLRTLGYQEALSAAGLALPDELVLPVPEFRRADGAAAARGLMRLPDRPDALLCLNDHLALGAVRALHEDGWSVPEDVDVVGFDDIEATRFSIPTITTVAPDKRGIARRAVRLLLDRIEAGAPGGPAVDETAGHRLIVRESSGA